MREEAFDFNQSTVKPLMITDQTFSPSGITSGSYQFWGVAHFITSATANPSTSVMPAIINEYSKAVCLAAGGQGFMDYPSLPASLKNAHLPPGTTISTSDATGASATSAYLGRFGLPQLPIKYIGCLLQPRELIGYVLNRRGRSGQVRISLSCLDSGLVRTR
jgi:hypothetical protein